MKLPIALAILLIVSAYAEPNAHKSLASSEPTELPLQTQSLELTEESLEPTESLHQTQNLKPTEESLKPTESLHQTQNLKPTEESLEPVKALPLTANLKLTEKSPKPIDSKLPEFCADKSDGNYPFEKTCAQSFVTCTNGSPSITHCPMNTRYSPAEDACLEPTRVIGCEQNADGTLNPCVGRVTGFYAMPERCREFVFCVDEKPLELSCNEGLVFDPDSSSCQKPSKVHGPCGMMPPRTSFDCEGKQPGFHMQEGDCRTYFFCDVDGTISSLACPMNYAFDTEMDMCRPATEVDGCMPPRVDEMRDFCLKLDRDGVFADPSDCDGGVICLQTYAYKVTCGPVRKLFDGHLLACVEEHTVEGECIEKTDE